MIFQKMKKAAFSQLAAAKSMKMHVMLFVALLFSLVGFSQTTGKVVSKDGTGIPAVSISSKGKVVGVSDLAGKFSVPVTTGLLTFSSTGYEEVTVNAGGNMEVVLATKASSGSDVVVVGYGTARRKDLTGAVASIRAKDFNQGAISSPDQLLQSKIAGVLVTTNSGEPGAGTTVQIRGNSSLRANNNPLYVVDGVPLDGRNAEPGFSSASFGATPSSNPLLFINPNDIASMEVLKDASSAAIYGARGANGVVVITTKKGANGAMKIDVGADFGFYAGYMKKFEILNRDEFVSALGKYGGASTLNGGANVDALKEITGANPSQAFNVAMSGGNENGRYRASFFANNAQGFVKGTGLHKYIANFSGSSFLLDRKLTVDYNVSAASVDHDFGMVSNTAGSQGNLISAALQWNPTTPFKNAQGEFIYPTNGSGNPLAFIDGVKDRAITNSIFGNISGAYKLTKNLEYKMLFAVNQSNGVRKTNYPGWWQGYTGVTGVGLGAISTGSLNSQTITHTLNYNTDITEKLHLNAVGGYEYWKSNFAVSSFQASGFNTNLTQATKIPILYTSMMQNANSQSTPFSYVDPQIELQSYFGRGIFNYDDKYILTATVRRDGSSKFGANNKYGTFPSVGFRWAVNNESFMKDNKVFSTLGLRASWGITGNQEYPAGAAQEQFSFGAFNSAGQVNVFNPNLKWENTKATNFGLDFGLLNGKVFGSLDIYNKNTSDLLYQSLAIQPAPATNTWQNLPATLNNKGIELLLGATILQNAKIGWDLSFNISQNKNKLTDFNQALIQTGTINGQGLSGALAQAITNNQPLQVYYLKPFNGFDASGNQLVGDNPAIGADPNPSTTYGFSNTLRYKNKLTFVVNAGGSAGFYIYNNTANGVTNIAGIIQGRNIDKAAFNSPEKASSGIAASDRFLEKGNFFKLRNASLSYNVGNVGKFFKGLTFSLTGNNLFVITKFTGFDPEVNIDKSTNGYPSKSIEYIPYPTPRSVQFGIRFSL